MWLMLALPLKSQVSTCTRQQEERHTHDEHVGLDYVHTETNPNKHVPIKDVHMFI